MSVGVRFLPYMLHADKAASRWLKSYSSRPVLTSVARACLWMRFLSSVQPTTGMSRWHSCSYRKELMSTKP